MASFSHVFLTIFLLCVSIRSGSCDLIQKECARVHQQYATDAGLCTKVLSSDPNSAKAQNLIDLTLAALKLGETTAHQIVVRIDGTLSNGKLSSELKTIVAGIRNEMNNVKDAFAFAHGVVNTRGDFDDADYSVSTMTDNFRNARNWLNQANGKMDPAFYQSSIDVLSVLRNIGLVLINDADPHTE